MIGNNEEFERLPSGIILFKGKTYIPPSLREIVISQHHDAITAGHPGVKRTRELIERQYWWPDLLSDIQKYVKGCTPCQSDNPTRSKRTAPLNPMDISTLPWEKISVDIIGPLPESNGFNAILVIVDYHTKMKILCPTTTELTAYGTAELFRTNVFKRFGLPRKVVSD